MNKVLLWHKKLVLYLERGKTFDLNVDILLTLSYPELILLKSHNENMEVHSRLQVACHQRSSLCLYLGELRPAFQRWEVCVSYFRVLVWLPYDTNSNKEDKERFHRISDNVICFVSGLVYWTIVWINLIEVVDKLYFSISSALRSYLVNSLDLACITSNIDRENTAITRKRLSNIEEKTHPKTI